MNISALEFDSSYKNAEGFLIVDVREPIEFNTFNLGGMNLPLADLIRNIEDLDIEKDQPIVVLCQHGIRSKTAVQVLEHNGYTKVRNLKDGILAWRRFKEAK